MIEKRPGRARAEAAASMAAQLESATDYFGCRDGRASVAQGVRVRAGGCLQAVAQGVHVVRASRHEARGAAPTCPPPIQVALQRLPRLAVLQNLLVLCNTTKKKQEGGLCRGHCGGGKTRAWAGQAATVYLQQPASLRCGRVRCRHVTAIAACSRLTCTVGLRLLHKALQLIRAAGVRSVSCFLDITRLLCRRPRHPLLPPPPPPPTPPLPASLFKTWMGCEAALRRRRNQASSHAPPPPCPVPHLRRPVSLMVMCDALPVPVSLALTFRMPAAKAGPRVCSTGGTKRAPPHTVRASSNQACTVPPAHPCRLAQSPPTCCLTVCVDGEGDVDLGHAAGRGRDA